MRIAWITYDFEEYSALHVNAMAKEHEVLLAMPQHEDGESGYFVADNVEHYAFTKPRLRQPFKQIQSVRQIVNRVHEFQPDVVHFQQGHLWFNFVLRQLKKYPLVVTIHDPRHHAGDSVSQKTPQWVIDHGFRKADHVVVHGSQLVPQVRELFGFPEERIHVIPHVAMGQAAQPESTGTEEPNTVLFFGRIWNYKGLDYLIRAQPQITEAVPDARIIIGGQGEDFDRYEQMMTDRDRFEIHNRWISDEERATMFERSAVVVLPYTEATQSGVIPVAYTHGKPVVATRVGALEESVDHNETGILVPPRNVDELASAIIRLLQNPELRHSMGTAAKQKLERELSPEVVAAQTVEAYRAAIESRGVPTVRSRELTGAAS
ncbi:MAG: glycosyltransferase family 4 protein [Planctomycetota bacterium]